MGRCLRGIEVSRLVVLVVPSAGLGSPSEIRLGDCCLLVGGISRLHISIVFSSSVDT